MSVRRGLLRLDERAFSLVKRWESAAPQHARQPVVRDRPDAIFAIAGLCAAASSVLLLIERWFGVLLLGVALTVALFSVKRQLPHLRALVVAGQAGVALLAVALFAATGQDLYYNRLLLPIAALVFATPLLMRMTAMHMFGTRRVTGLLVGTLFHTLSFVIVVALALYYSVALPLLIGIWLLTYRVACAGHSTLGNAEVAPGHHG